MSAVEIIATLTLVFVVAAVLLVLAGRYSLPVIPFYLLAGLCLGVVVDEAQLLDLAQWGIAFLVFAFAVELDPFETSGSLELDSALVAVVQLAVTGAVLYAVGLGLGFDPLQAVFFAIAGSLSSSLVALSVLERRIRLRSLHERLAESIHFVEDTAAILLILVLSAVVYADGTAAPLVAGLGLIGGGVVVRRYAFERVIAFAEGDVEILMLTGVSLIIGFIALAELAGLSIVVGAFAAGIAVSSTYPHDVEMVDAISYLEDFFVPIFFVTLGALVVGHGGGTAPSFEAVGVGAVLVVAVVVINPAITYALLRWRRYDSRTAVQTGLTLDQVSEFALIIAIEALVAERLAPDLFDAIVLAAIATMFLSAATQRYAETIYRRLVEVGFVDPGNDAVRSQSDVAEDLENHVIVTGYDREGQQVVEACESAGREYVVIETDPTRFDTVRERCVNYVFGDVTAQTTWTVARAETASLIVATVPRSIWAERILSFEVGADTIVRAADVESGSALLERGALFVAIPDVLVAERLRENVEALLTGELSREELRERGRERLESAVEYGPTDVERPR